MSESLNCIEIHDFDVLVADLVPSSCLHVSESLDQGNTEGESYSERRYKVYTDKNQYTITACVEKKGADVIKSYLGCIATSRKKRAGESWARGNDLPDGALCVEVWDKIVRAIVSYELVKVHVKAQVENDPQP